MVIAMVALTVIYNGFIYGRPGPDGILRLVLIITYAGANIAHILWSSWFLSQIIDAVGNQACWVTISRICLLFSVDEHNQWLRILEALSREDLLASRPKWRQVLAASNPLHLKRFKCDLIGSTKHSESYVSLHPKRRQPGKKGPSSDMSEEQKDASMQLFSLEETTINSVAEDDMKPVLDAEVKAFEKAGESGLDRVLANVIVILGICLSTGLAPWTSVQSQDSTATQVGSYALILALGTGATALIGSINHLRNAVESAKTLQRFQAHMLSLPTNQASMRLSARAARYGSKATESLSVDGVVTLMDLFGSTSPWLRPFFLVWGPGLGLLPSSRKNAKPKGNESLDSAQTRGEQTEPLTGQGSDGSNNDNSEIDHTGVMRFEFAGSDFQLDATAETLVKLGPEGPDDAFLKEFFGEIFGKRATNEPRSEEAPTELGEIAKVRNIEELVESISLQDISSQAGPSKAPEE